MHLVSHVEFSSSLLRWQGGILLECCAKVGRREGQALPYKWVRGYVHWLVTFM